MEDKPYENTNHDVTVTQGRNRRGRRGAEYNGTVTELK